MVPSTKELATNQLEAHRKLKAFATEFAKLVDDLICISRCVLVGVEGMEDDYNQLVGERKEESCKSCSTT